MEVSVLRNEGISWVCDDKIFAKGYFISSCGKKYYGDDMIKYFENIDLDKDLIRYLKRVNGNFSLIIENFDNIYLIVDHIRSFPIFYCLTEDGIIISDDINYIKEQLDDLKYNKYNVMELLMTGFTTDTRTIYGSIYQLNAGECLVYNKKLKKIVSKETYCLSTELEVIDDKEQILEKMDIFLKQVFLDFINSVDGQTIVVPLSGGYDSRLILFYLKKLKYKKVICYTYGHKNQVDVKLAKELANYLGYKWIFIPYKRGYLYNLFQSEDGHKYREYASNGNAIPHLQDWSAVYYLNENALIPTDAIFVPGHTAFLSFQNYSDDTENKNESLIREIIKKHYFLWPFEKNTLEVQQYYESNIQAIVQRESSDIFKNTYNKMFFWEWRERHAKFICNSVRAYEFFDYQWRLPLWDNRLINLWASIDIKYKKNKQIFKQYMKLRFPNELTDPNPKRTLKLKIAERIYGYHKLGRFNGNKSILKSFFVRNVDLVSNKDIFCNQKYPFIQKNKLIIFENFNTIVSLIYLDEKIKSLK